MYLRLFKTALSSAIMRLRVLLFFLTACNNLVYEIGFSWILMDIGDNTLKKYIGY